MNSWLATLLTATISFAATNVDDLVILALFFSQTKSRWRVVVGQYLGFSALVVISLIGFFGGRVAPREWVGLLGIAPIAIGIKKLLRKGHPEEERPASAVLDVALVTFANGGDNIGVYAPLFATVDSVRLSISLTVFYVLLGVWCFAGYLISRRRYVGSLLSRYGHWIVPFVLIALGISIILTSGTLSLIR